MKIQVLSDLHFDVDPVRDDVGLADGADAVVVAGDVCEGLGTAFDWLVNRFGSSIPIVIVAGNHSYYRRSYTEELKEAQSHAHKNVHFLENSTVKIGTVVFMGATLWTDYCLFGEHTRTHAMLEASSKMMDHKRISYQKNPWKRFRPQEAALIHKKAVDFIHSECAVSTRPVVVVTHHAPSPRSLPPMFRDALLSAAYASDLEKLISRTKPSVWIHGHVHNSSDYFVDETRVLCNPHGYGPENPKFDPTLTIHV